MDTENTIWNTVNKKSVSQYTIVAFAIDVDYNECSRLLDTVGGKNQ